MANKIACLYLLLHAVFSLLSVPESAAQYSESTPRELIVKLKSTPVAAKAGQTQPASSGTTAIDAIHRAFAVKNVQPLFENAFRNKQGAALLRGILKIAIPVGADPEELLAAYSSDPNIAYAHFNHVYRIDSAPDDPLFPQQAALEVVQAEQAWEVQLASPDVIVGVIDTGIDYLHEDLREAIWINAAEDLNHNGAVDSTDFNGLDDDGNGFIDDIRGWDFTDAPTFPDGGDFRTPDNDPFDENGHGTSVAGIIGATGNNAIGIAGLAYGCRIMNLRAGTSRGFLEEDDVASAVVYAVENGARVINMSFGDVVASPLLHDVVQYATTRNCVVVASAGNAATDRIHFPSGFSETISVGATDLDDNLASFSNYGSSVDLVAPGLNILTTSPGDAYVAFSGTSASAPFVSALAALVLSKTPEHAPESLKGLLISTTDDLGDAGWDNFFAAGRINARKAVASPYFSAAQIVQPTVNQGFSGLTPVPVRVTATGTFLEEILLQIGVGETPDQWEDLARVSHRQMVDAVLFELDIGALPDTLYTLRLIVQNKNGTAVEDKVPFFIDNSDPVISNVHITPMLDGELQSFLIEFDTDDVCHATLHVQSNATGGLFEQIPLRFLTTEHRYLVNRYIAPGRMSFWLEVSNAAGLSSTATNNGHFFTVNVRATSVGSVPIEGLNRTFPSGFILNKISDFDGDGQPEIIINQYQNNFTFGPLKILETAQQGYEQRFATTGVFIPRDWGDSDNDGLPEILAGNGPSSFIFEAPVVDAFPTQMVWADSGNAAWAVRFSDLDQDGRGEVILRLDDLYTIWESRADNQYVLVDSLPNPTGGDNFVGVPHVETGDFDGDGLREILIGDVDGDIYIYENRGDDRYEFTWSDRLPLVDATDYLSVGDYDGDGMLEFVAGCHSDENLNLESNFDSRHWRFRVYKSTSDDQFSAVWEQAFFGFQSPKDFDSGVASGDVDNDGRDEILLSIFPDFYLIDFEGTTGEHRVIWHEAPARSNTTIIADLNNDGRNEFYFNRGDAITGRQILTGFTGPPTPTAFGVRPLGPRSVQLTWQPPSSSDGFRVYRAQADDPLAPFAVTDFNTFVDTTVSTRIEYAYAVSMLDSTLSPAESLLSPVLRVTPNPQPFVKSATFLAPQQILVRFSEPMDGTVKNHTNYTIAGVGPPRSAIFGKSGRQVILTINGPIEPGEYTLHVVAVADLQGTPIDPHRNAAMFSVPVHNPAPYIVTAELVNQHLLRLTFSTAMDQASVSQIENYTIEPNIGLAAAAIDPENPQRVLLSIDTGSPIGAFGVDYFVTVRNVRSQAGAAIAFGLGDTAALIFSSPDLSHVFAYPNPYHASSTQTFVTIAGLTSTATVRILDANGRLIRTLEETDGNGGLQWDLKNEQGKDVPSGIYVIYVTGGGKKGMGKLAVLR